MGGSAGSGKSSQSTSSTDSPYAGLLAKFGKSALPIFQQLNSQIGEALRTGGVNAGIPIINRSVDAAREASSTSTESTRQSLARSNLGNSSFGQNILAQEGNENAQNIAQIPTSAASSFIGMAPGQTSQGIKAAGTAGALDNTTIGTQTPSWWQTFIQGINTTFNPGGKQSSSGDSGYASLAAAF